MLPRPTALLAALLVAAAQIVAQDDRPVLLFEYAGMEGIAADGKDKALVGALKMLPTRVRELQREIPDFPAEAGALADMVLTHLARPARVALVYNEGNPGGFFGYGMVLSIAASDRDDAEQLHATVAQLLRQGAPQFAVKASARWGTMSEVQLPMGLIAFGPRETGGGWRYELIVGSLSQPDAVFDGLPRPERGETALGAMVFDAAGLAPMLDMAEFAAGNNPEALEMIGKVRESGAVGEDGLRATVQMGFTATHAVTRTAVHHLSALEGVFPISKEPLEASDLRAIPADATFASLGRADFGWIRKGLSQARAQDPQVAEALDQFREITGVDFENDLVSSLGGTVGMYLSDATGGGSLMSGVALISFKDRAKFMQSHGRVMAAANNLADQLPIGPGYIRLKGWKDGELSLVSLRFPGLPVPFEPTYAFTDRWLVVGLTPQAALAGARQASGKGDAGLASNPGFAATLPKRPLVSISYLDTGAFLRQGYAPASMITSGIANAMRSPIDPGREPGLLLPVFHELARDVRPQTEFTYWDGEVLRVDSFGDRSLLVNSTGMLGLIAKVAPVVAVPAVIGGMQGRGRPFSFDLMDDGPFLPTPGRLLVLGTAAVLEQAAEEAWNQP